MEISRESCNHLFDIINKNIAIYETFDGENFVFKDFNRFAEITENIKRENVIGKNIIDVFPGVIDFGLLDVIKKVYKTGIPESFPLKIYQDKRISGWRENYIYKLPSGEVVAIYDDLTKMKQLEESLKNSEELFRSFFENNKAVILKIDPESLKITDCNKAAVNYYGYNKSELTRKTIDELNTLTKDEIRNRMAKITKNKSNVLYFRHKLANGEIRDIELYVSPINVQNKLYLFTIIHDITTRIRTQKAVIENQRLSAVGEMAASIAHDFNNSLQAIGGNIELCLYEHEDITPKLLSKLKILQSNINDASNRVKSLLTFSGYKNNNTSDKKIININSIIDNIIFQSRPLWKSTSARKGLKIEIIKNYSNDFYTIGNSGLLSSALFNLLKNSIEAMPEGGRIIFSVKKNNDKINIEIKDTGTGMDEDTQIRVFQPFFSTKGMEVGRGLGMSGVYNIIKEHNGNIRVKESKLNYGTTIEVILPAVENTENIQLKNNNIKTLNKDLKILWVDDDSIITSLAEGYLKVLKTEGKVVSSGQKALKILRNTDKYNVLITDIGMSEMNGWQLIDNIRNKLKNNKIRIILLSGWEVTEKELINKYQISHVLQKPVTINDLKNVLKQEIPDLQNKNIENITK